MSPTVAPVLPPFLATVQERIAGSMVALRSVPGRYGQFRLNVQVSTPGNLYIDWVTIRRTDKEATRWSIWTDMFDDARDRSAVSAEGATLDEAWSLFAAALQQTGECQECGCITLDEDGAGCGPCQARAALLPPTECTICSLSKHNIYHMVCGHKMCRNCALRCETVKRDGDEYKKCPFGCTRRLFAVNQGLKEEDFDVIECTCDY